MQRPNGEPARERRAIPVYFYPPLTRDDRTAAAQTAETFNATDPATVAAADLLVYVHIPFCQNVCRFCGFYRNLFGGDAGRLETYVDRLLAELRWWSESGLLADASVNSIYVGGGTPSLLPPAQIDRLLGALRAHLPLERDDVELSFEGEARSLADPERLAVLRAHGVSRVSFGVQSLDPQVRQWAGLAASLDDLQACAAAVREHGYSVCVDLLFGLPGQTPEIFRQDIAGAVERLGASLIDLYELILYPNAAIYADLVRTGRPPTTGADREAMYQSALEYFHEAGFRQWSLEDFCRPGEEYSMKHLVYGGDDGTAQTLALGACAVGYFGGHTYRNEMLEPYLATPNHLPPVATMRTANAYERGRRPLFFFPRRLFLRPDQVPGGLDARVSAILDRQIADGWAIRDAQGTVRLTTKGMLRADDIVRDFLSGNERRKLFKIVQ